MTDQDLIARTVRALGDDPAFGEYEHRRTAERFADALSRPNPEFDRTEFLTACGADKGG